MTKKDEIEIKRETLELFHHDLEVAIRNFNNMQATIHMIVSNLKAWRSNLEKWLE